MHHGPCRSAPRDTTCLGRRRDSSQIVQEEINIVAYVITEPCNNVKDAFMAEV